MRLEAFHMLMSLFHANARQSLQEIAASKDAHLQQRLTFSIYTRSNLHAADAMTC